MKDDILKFRKTCNVLIADKGYNKNKISIESKLNWPTLKKVLEDPIDKIKIAASNLGLIQDFNKKHLDDVSYAGIVSWPVEVKGSDISSALGREIKRRKIASSQAPRNDAAEKRKNRTSPAARDRNDVVEEVKSGLQPKNTDGFIKFIRKLTDECPSNLKIKITING